MATFSSLLFYFYQCTVNKDFICILGRVYMSVCLVRALTFESVDLETSFLVFRYIFKITRLSLYIKVIGQGLLKVKVTGAKTGYTSVTKWVRLRLKSTCCFYRPMDRVSVHQCPFENERRDTKIEQQAEMYISGID